MTWDLVFKLLVGAILALMVGCLLGCFVYLILEIAARHDQHKRVNDAINRIAERGQTDNVDSEKENG